MRTHGPKFRTFPSKVTRGLHPTSSSNPRVGTPAFLKAVMYPEGLLLLHTRSWARPRRTTWCILFNTFTAFMRTGEGINTAHRDSEDIGCITHPLSVGRAPITARVSTSGWPACAPACCASRLVSRAWRFAIGKASRRWDALARREI